MSRRTKLLTLVIFVVLLGIVALYAAQWWTVKEPLRFRLVGVSHPVKETPPQEGWQLVRYEVEARNVSSVPVTIERVFLGPEYEVWFEYQGRNISRSIGLREGINIGGHKTVKMGFYYYLGLTEDDDLHPEEINYLWKMTPRRRLNSWLRGNAPGPLRFRIHELNPSYGSATLEIAPGSHLRAMPADDSKR